MVVVGAGTLFGKILAMVKDMTVASYFGTSDAVDAFFIALAVPTFAINVVAGSLPVALMPVYVRVRDTQGLTDASRLLSNVLVVATGLILLASLLLVVAAPIVLPLSGATFSGEKLELTRQLFFLLLPAIFVSGISGILAVILNAHERFWLAAVTPAFTAVMSILFLLTTASRWGIYALAVGLGAGYLAELLVLAWSLRRRGLLARGDWAPWRKLEVREVLAQYTPLAIGAAVMSSSPLIDQAMAAALGPRNVASLAYGSKVVAAGLGIGVTAVATAIFPHFSSMVAANNWFGVRQTLRTYSRLVLAGAVPVVLLIVFFTDSIIHVLFERGEFTPSDTRVVGHVQALFALQIPFYIVGMIGVRLLSAAGANRTLMWLSMGNFVTNIVGNYVFMRLWGVAGIALSTSVMYAIAATIAYYAVIRRINHLEAQSA